MFYKAIKGKSFIVFNADVLLIFSPLGGTVSLQVKNAGFFHTRHIVQSQTENSMYMCWSYRGKYKSNIKLQMFSDRKLTMSDSSCVDEFLKSFFYSSESSVVLSSAPSR